MKTFKLSFVFILSSFLFAGCGESGDESGGGRGDVILDGEGSALLTWTKPTQNTDDTSLTDLDGFNVYFGSQADYEDDPGRFTPWVISVNNADATTNHASMNCTNQENGTKIQCSIEGLDNSTNWFFAITAINSLNIESPRSNVACKTFSNTSCDILIPSIETVI
jgi:hypothetical protein